MNNLLEKLYYSLDSPAAFSSREKLYQEARKKNKTIKRKDVDKWLQKQLTYTLHKPARINFKTRRVIVYNIDDQWQMDLVDLSKFSKFNSGYKYLLVCIDIFSKYAWVEPLKSKNAVELKRAIQSIFNRDKRKPKVLQTDKGTEFLNAQVKTLLKENKIKLFMTNSERKASVVERLNRTLKGLMFKYLTKENTRTYIDVLPQLVEKYNNSHHRAIKMKPNEVTNGNSPKVWLNLYEKFWNTRKKKQHKLNVGDKVRLSIEKTLFQKRYDQLWTEEIFTITNVIAGNPTVYKISDYAGEPIKGTFYFEELQKVVEPETYRIEKIIRKRRNPDGSISCLVKWLGFPEKFNSYVLQEDLEKI